MAATAQIPPEVDLDEARLAADERWLLVTRILSSDGFQRAGQLRKILVYVCRSAILEPERVFHEYEIACDVLDRRPDFDPANDNIVRAQVSHLRRKLEKYFTEDNPSEPLLLTIPRGTYIPHFLANPNLQQRAIAAVEEAPAVATVSPTDKIETLTPVAPATLPWWRTWTGAGMIFCAVLCVALSATLALDHKESWSGAAEKAAPGNGLIPILARWDGNVSVVLPDTSASLIRYITGIAITAADYSSNDYPKRQIATMQDPEVRQVLDQLSQKRNTTVSEAKIGFNLVESLNRAGGHGVVRYARDIHVRDLNEGSIILIGAQPSNPWVTLFADRTNFQYVKNLTSNEFCFRNFKPLPGEDLIYPVSSEVTADRVNYVDIAFLPNPLQSGYILLIIGSDLAANEAAGNLILHGKLPAKITSLLNGKEPRSFEIFLRGKHISNEAEDSLEVLSVRTDADMPTQGTKVSH